MKTNQDNSMNNELFPRYEKCLLILKQEIDLLNKITSVQTSVRNAVINREWADFDTLLNSLDEYSDEFEALEFERDQLFASYTDSTNSKDAHAGFYVLASRLPDEQRKEITSLYRTLKLEILKIRVSNEALASYLIEAKTTIAGFLEAAFPDRKGRLYSRQGTHVPSDMRSIVLNRSL